MIKGETLNQEQKVKLLEELASSISVELPTEEHGMGMTSMYDPKKQMNKLLKICAESSEQKLTRNRKMP